MNKAILIIAILVAAFAYTEANRCHIFCPKSMRHAIRCVKEGSICRKMGQCSIDEENCRRRISKRPRITSTSLDLCRNIKGSEGKGPCAIKKRGHQSVKPRCRHIKCPSDSKKQNCYSSKDKQCQLLTSCQLKRINCLRGKKNRLERVDLRRCDGMKAGKKLQKCRPVPKRSSTEIE